MNRPDQRLFSLRFRPESLEADFQEDHRNRTVWFFRLAVLVGSLQYGLLGLLDAVMIPGAFVEVRLVRLAVCTVGFLVLAGSFHPVIRRHQQALAASVALAAGSGVVAILYLTQGAESYIYPFLGMMLVFLFVHVLLQLQFRWATLISWALFVCFAMVAFKVRDQNVQILANQLTFLAMANVSGMVGGFTIEWYSRRVFWQRLILEREDERKARELEDVRQLQKNLLPEAVPALEQADVGVFMLTATEIGGDYYDFHPSSDGSLTFVIGDATGHGARAGGLVTATKVLFDSLSEEPNIEDILHRSTRSLRQAGQSRLFMALAVGRLTGQMLELVGAGLPPAIVWRAASRTIEMIPLKGVPLGSPFPMRYARTSHFLQPGDTLVLMTDGFPELFDRDSSLHGYEHVRDLVMDSAGGSAEDVVSRLHSFIHDRVGTERPPDDVTLVVLRMTPVTESVFQQTSIPRSDGVEKRRLGVPDQDGEAPASDMYE